MFTVEFTPGPWEIKEIQSNRRVSIVSGFASVAYVHALVQKTANAHLIAAAPTLYEALVLILPLAKGYAPDGQSDCAKKTCRAWIEAAEAALARARGEQS